MGMSERGLKEERTEKHKIKREKKTEGIKKPIFCFKIMLQCNSKGRIAL